MGPLSVSAEEGHVRGAHRQVVRGTRSAGRVPWRLHRTNGRAHSRGSLPAACGGAGRGQTLVPRPSPACSHRGVRHGRHSVVLCWQALRPIHPWTALPPLALPRYLRAKDRGEFRQTRRLEHRPVEVHPGRVNRCASARRSHGHEHARLHVAEFCRHPSLGGQHHRCGGRPAIGGEQGRTGPGRSWRCGAACPRHRAAPVPGLARCTPAGGSPAAAEAAAHRGARGRGKGGTWPGHRDGRCASERKVRSRPGGGRRSGPLGKRGLRPAAGRPGQFSAGGLLRLPGRRHCGQGRHAACRAWSPGPGSRRGSGGLAGRGPASGERVFRLRSA